MFDWQLEAMPEPETHLKPERLVSTSFSIASERPPTWKADTTHQPHIMKFKVPRLPYPKPRHGCENPRRDKKEEEGREAGENP